MKFVNVGFGNSVSAERIIAVVSPEAAPIKRIVQEAKDKGTAIDATCGRKTRAVIIMDSGIHIGQLGRLIVFSLWIKVVNY